MTRAPKVPESAKGRTEPRQETGKAKLAVGTFLARIGVGEIVIVAVTTGICVWGWLAYVTTGTTDFLPFMIVYGVALTASALLQCVMVMYVRPSGSLRARLSWGAVFKGAPTDDRWSNTFGAQNLLVMTAPVALSILVFLIVTPATTPTATFDPDMGLYRVIGLLALLGIVFTSIGAGVIVPLVLMPLGMLVAACLPVDRDAEGRPVDRATMTTTAELAIAASILLSAVGFALTISSVETSSSLSKPGRMIEQFITFVTFTGNPLPTTLGWFFIAVIVVAVIADRRAHKVRLRVAEQAERERR